MGAQLTGLGALVALLWILTDYWEWTVPEGIGHKITDWKKKCYKTQITVKFTNQESIYRQEQFAFSLKRFLRDMEQEMGMPVHCEIELWGEKDEFSEEELLYIKCLNQSFTGFTWSIQETIPQPKLGDQGSS
ncbi:hypothetical protein Desde_4069 [Desulfitobacterium dehalogenans ATCC 51507]|uniref:Uncharacterized protein n=2 Tax=Desulfitobacteriaceae TaxID=2937909 RepID=I4AEE5_DESDJ|nr:MULTISPECIES: hypothetical protein [Desulfitobacterium]AFM02330.1 hypothetical protein Desde_4069 [Desulfitobacterium dehalogenans ATCC 51507]